MAGFFESQAFNSRVLRQPVSPLAGIGEALQCFTQRHSAMFAQVVARSHNMTRSSNWKTMRASLSKRPRHLFALTFHQKRSHCLDRSQSHGSRGAGSEDAEDQFFPESLIRAGMPDFLKLSKPCSNLSSSRLVCGAYACNSNGLEIASHYDLSIC